MERRCGGRWLVLWVGLGALFLPSCGQATLTSSSEGKVVYGRDDRIESFQLPQSSALNRVASATLLMTNSEKLRSLRAGHIKLDHVIFKKRLNVCNDEPYANQPLAGFCTAFLVAPNIVATAGHCANDIKCREISFVSKFALKSKNDTAEDVTTVPEGRVYSCRKILFASEAEKTPDMAIIQLDRKVAEAKPLKISEDRVKVNETVYTVGHPLGLPQKIAPGLVKKTSDKDQFVATLDGYHGNSGSAVTNAEGELKGIYVNGEDDFDYDSTHNCYRTKVCQGLEDCQGEGVTYASHLQDALHSQPVIASAAKQSVR